MKDLYKQLGIDESVDEEEIRAALENAPAALRESAAFILLDPARRAVYDRNRRVLVTVGRLRAHLGLNLTNFWPRGRFGDFTIAFSPIPPAGTGAGVGRPTDPMRIAAAFGVDVRRAGRARRAGGRTVFWASAAALATIVSLAAWYWTRAH